MTEFQGKVLNMTGIKIKHYLLLCGCLLSVFGTFAQEKSVFTIRQVDSAFAVKNTFTGDYDQVLVGNVFLEEKQKAIKFFCDSAYKHEDTQILEAFGNVQLNRGDTIDVQGDYMSFNLLTNFLKVRNNVKLEHARAKCLTDSLDYDMNTEIGAYNYGGKLIDSTSTLTSRIGKYYMNTGDVEFKQNVKITGKEYTTTTDSLRYNVHSKKAFIIAPTDFVNKEYQMYSEQGVYNTATGISTFTKATRLTNKSYVLTGDNLEYNEKTGIGIVTKNCKLVDTIKNFILTSDYLESQRQDSTVLAVKNIELKYINKKDTLFAHSDTILIHKDTLHNNLLEIYRKVKFFKKDIQGKCDSMSLNSTDSIMRMFQNPTVWSGENQLTADTITAEFLDGKLKYVNLRKKALALSTQDSTLQFYNQIKGRDMRGIITNDTLRNIEVKGNSEVLFFQKEKLEYVGINHMRCSSISIRLKAGKMNNATFRTTPKGTLYPLSHKDKVSLYLPNFRQEAANRPRRREDIFEWKTTPKAEKEKIKKAVITEEEPEKDEKKKDNKAQKPF